MRVMKLTLAEPLNFGKIRTKKNCHKDRYYNFYCRRHIHFNISIVSNFYCVVIEAKILNRHQFHCRRSPNRFSIGVKWIRMHTHTHTPYAHQQIIFSAIRYTVQQIKYSITFFYTNTSQCKQREEK